MRRKHESLLKAQDIDDSASTGEVTQQLDKEESKEISLEELSPNQTTSEPLVIKSGSHEMIEVHSESETDADLEFYDKLSKLQRNKKTGDQFSKTRAVNMKVEFKDFMEPQLIRTGHVLPLSSGHNGYFSQTELTLYEIHLTNAGFICELEHVSHEENEPEPPQE